MRMLVVSVLLLSTAALAGTPAKKPGKNAKPAAMKCTFKGHKLWGKVQIVDAFPDFTVQVVDAFPELKVQKVDAFPDDCGKWQIVDAFPDFKVKIVDAFPDLKIQYVDAFPGLP